MLVKITILADGHGPSEKVIGVKTASGKIEQVMISGRTIKSSAIEVGLHLAHQDGNYLIELPRESTSGRWRIWIPESEVQQLEAAE